MRQTPDFSYLESRVLQASPLELVVILHEGALRNVRLAKAFLRSGKIRERGEAVSRAQQFVGELLASLRFSEAREIATRLDVLYRNTLIQLSTSHLAGREEDLNRAESTLETMFDAWQQLAQRPEIPPGHASPAARVPCPRAPIAARTAL